MTEEKRKPRAKNPHAVALGRLGSSRMTEGERIERARNAALVRWAAPRENEAERQQT
jgi:hypothetical protein